MCLICASWIGYSHLSVRVWRNLNLCIVLHYVDGALFIVVVEPNGVGCREGVGFAGEVN